MTGSELTSQEQITLAAYAQIASEWVVEHASRGFWAEDMALFRRHLPGGRILEIGSGGGRDAKELLELGYDYLGTDISEALLVEARKAVPYGTFLHKSVYNLDFPESYFDGFWASAVLLHLPKARTPKALERIHFVVRNNGVGFISLKQGTGEEVIEEETANGLKYRRFFAFYSQDEFDKVLIENEFRTIECSITVAGPSTTWLKYIVQVVK